ncbi:hypothetical protein AKO1_003402 [Acrasis kona]|uniref:YqaJ viral recombinase domain-containing protein n=1 Tax=Acrasis kona TaxID=1008807 RepID=A0AAW2ZMV0_9EUKA
MSASDNVENFKLTEDVNKPNDVEDVDVDSLIDQFTQAKIDSGPKYIINKPSAFVGENPNVLWRSVAIKVLNEHPQYQMGQGIVHQRTPEWFELRKNRITGSQFANALGFFDKSSIKRLKLKPTKTYHHPERVCIAYNEVLHYIPVESQIIQPEDQSVQQVFMNWGTNHETNALLTYLKEFKDHTVCETSFKIIDDIKLYIEKNCNIEDFQFVKNFDVLRIGASPDGIILENGVERSVLEAKCPTPFVPDGKNEGMFRYLKRKPQDHVPVYYIPQIMAEMMVTGLPMCTYCSWTATCGMSVFEIDFNKEYVNEMLYWCYRYIEHIGEYLKEHSLTDAEVFQGVFENEKRYQTFLDMSLNISASARRICTVEKSVVGNQHSKMFL